MTDRHLDSLRDQVLLAIAGILMDNFSRDDLSSKDMERVAFLAAEKFREELATRMVSNPTG